MRPFERSRSPPRLCMTFSRVVLLPAHFIHANQALHNLQIIVRIGTFLTSVFRRVPHAASPSATNASTSLSHSLVGILSVTRGLLPTTFSPIINISAQVKKKDSIDFLRRMNRQILSQEKRVLYARKCLPRFTIVKRREKLARLTPLLSTDIPRAILSLRITKQM